jgi:hypothetical protein
MDCIDLTLHVLLAGAASSAAVAAWFHDGTAVRPGLFENARDFLTAYSELDHVRESWWRFWFVRLLLCPFCLTYYVGGALCTYTLLTYMAPVEWRLFWRLPVYILATAFMTHIANRVYDVDAHGADSEYPRISPDD